jgi:hypothetical protein
MRGVPHALGEDMNDPVRAGRRRRFSAAPIATLLACSCGGNTVSGSPSDAATSPFTDAPALPPDAPDDASAALDGSADAVTAYVQPLATQIVDSMSGPVLDGPGTGGNWFTYSDRQLPWAEPAIETGAPGVLTPPAGIPISPTNDGQGPPPGDGGMPLPYRRFSGGGEATWGAGLALNFAFAEPDGGPVPMNACDAGAVFDVDAAGMDSAINLPFDASGWTGLQFWVKSLIGYPRTVQVIVEDDRTNPFGLPPDAGGCNVCANFTGGMGYCGDGPRASVVFPSDWRHIQLPFASLHPLGTYSGEPTTWTPHTMALYAVNFQLEDAPLAPFDLAVAYVELYR